MTVIAPPVEDVIKKQYTLPKEYIERVSDFAYNHKEHFKRGANSTHPNDSAALRYILDVFFGRVSNLLDESIKQDTPVTTEEVMTNLVERGIISSPVDILDDLPAIVDLSANALQPFPATEE